MEGVTAVHDELWFAHQRGCLLRIQVPNLLPLGHHHHRVGTSERLVGVEGGLNGAKDAPSPTLHSPSQRHPHSAVSLLFRPGASCHGLCAWYAKDVPD